MADLKQEWTDKIADWRASGLSIAAWCRQHDQNYHRFLYWRRRLEPQQAKAGGFVELTFRSSSLALECNGMTLHLVRGFDPELLRDVLSVLRTV
jgi:hypothetical protein